MARSKGRKEEGSRQSFSAPLYCGALCSPPRPLQLADAIAEFEKPVGYGTVTTAAVFA